MRLTWYSDPAGTNRSSPVHDAVTIVLRSDVFAETPSYGIIHEPSPGLER